MGIEEFFYAVIKVVLIMGGVLFVLALVGVSRDRLPPEEKKKGLPPDGQAAEPRKKE